MRFYSKIASALAVCAAALISASCVQEMKDQQMPEFITGITVTGQDVDFSEFETKVSYNDRLAFSWNEGDRLGIFPIGGRQQLFPLSDIGNGTSANFDGGAWALRSSYEYAGYYPFADEKSNTEDLMLPVDYTHQKQIGNKSTANLGEYSYMVSEATKPNAAGSVNLQMKQLGGVVRAEATVPAGIDFCRATLVDNSAEMIVGGKVDLGRKHVGSSAFVPEIEEPVYGDRVVIDFEDVVVEESADGSNNLIFYFWMAPQSLSGHELSLVLEERGGEIYTLNTTCGIDLVAAKGKRIDFGSVVEPEDVDYLCITALTYSLIRLDVEASRYWDGPKVEYSRDGKSWSDLGYSIVDIQEGESIYLRGDNDAFSLDDERYAHFTIPGRVMVSGNIMTLLDKRGLRNSVGEYGFYRLFLDCVGLVSAPELPSESLATGCYEFMFSGCTNLLDAPELPAKSLAKLCYAGMFDGCTSLTSEPELPAETLAESCYSSMFSDCVSLINAPELPAQTLALGCYSLMFSGCTSLTDAPVLRAETLAPNCCYGMFWGCTDLVNAPRLQVETLSEYCYMYMFNGCTSLMYAPQLPAETLAPFCYYGMFYGCTNLIEAPALPAENLANGCYRSMFYRCRNLNQVNASFVNVPDTGCISGWLNGVAAEGTLYKNPNATWTREEAQIPEGWAIITGTGASGEDLDPEW